MGDVTQLMWAVTAEARVAQAAGDAEAQAAGCEPLLALSGREALDEPAIQSWRELSAEALVRAARALQLIVGLLDALEVVALGDDDAPARRRLVKMMATPDSPSLSQYVNDDGAYVLSISASAGGGWALGRCPWRRSVPGNATVPPSASLAEW